MEPLMKQFVSAVTLVVRDYDEAIAYYTQALGFEIAEDAPQTAGKRWVLVRPPGASECGLLLAKAKNEEERRAIGRQTGGRVCLFLHTDDFARDYARMKAWGVTFREEPRQEAYGQVVVFEDLYGNKWDLIQPSVAPATFARR
jgi:catechol 2,3-dioxygenase-like lactoylglutathione lyase family enzyme